MFKVVYERKPLDCFGDVDTEEYPLTQKAALEKNRRELNEILDYLDQEETEEFNPQVEN